MSFTTRFLPVLGLTVLATAMTARCAVPQPSTETLPRPSDTTRAGEGYREARVQFDTPEHVDKVSVETGADTAENAAAARDTTSLHFQVRNAVRVGLREAFGERPFESGGIDSLQGSFSAGFSIRNPQFDNRIIQVPDPNNPSATIPDTVSNPYEFSLGTGFRGSYGSLTFSMNHEFKRKTSATFSEYYINQQYSLEHRVRAYKVGGMLRQRQEGETYLLNLYAEAIFFGWVGAGLTRNYYTEWFQDPVYLARFSLARNNFDVYEINFNVQIVYEVGTKKHRFYTRVSTAAFTRGRFSLGPNIWYERIKGSRATYEGNVQLSIRI